MLKRNFERIIERATRPGAPPTLLVTIFLGANDACLIGMGKQQKEYVPLAHFEENIREFVETILIQDNMADTKIILISTPPINIPDPLPDDDDIPVTKQDQRKSHSYLTYMSKKRYAEKIMEIAKSYEETGRVAGLDLWRALIDAGLNDQDRLGDEDTYGEDCLPGSGLTSAKEFKPGYFTDGLHFGPLVGQSRRPD
jgi:lysophospholipase L1-like esterase